MKGDLKERIATALIEAAEGEKSRKARRDFAGCGTKMIGPRRPDGTVNASRSVKKVIRVKQTGVTGDSFKRPHPSTQKANFLNHDGDN